MRALGLVITIVCVASTARADALDKPAMTATPAELLAFAKTVKRPASGELELLLDTRYALDDQGRVTRRSRWLTYYVTAAPEPVVIEQDFETDHQDRPAVRARVIEAGGRETLLDPAKVAVDGEEVSARLDAPPAGSLVEVEIVITDHTPASPHGRTIWASISGPWSALRSTVELSAPAHKARSSPGPLPRGVKATHQVTGGREIWRYAWSTPGEDARVGISTVASWAEVAQTYTRMIEDVLAKPVAAGADKTVGGVVGWLHQHVKTLEGAGHPLLSPEDALQQGAGSRLSKAAALVALLRAAGQRAEVALVLPSSNVTLPSYESFALPVVRTGTTWIDASDELQRPGVLPALLQGKPALVLAAGTRDFVTTPVSKAEDNLIREVRTFTASEVGAAAVREVTREGGVFERPQRRWFRDEADSARTQLAEYLQNEYAATLRKQTTTGTADLSVPFELTLEADGAATVWTNRDAIEVTLYPRAALSRVDARLRNDEKPTQALDWQAPYIHEIENRVIVPPGYTMPALAADRTRSIGTAQLSEHQEIQDRTLIVRYRFASGKPHLSAAEAVALHDELARLSEETQTFKLDMTANALSAAGKPREALAELERLVRLHPKEALHHQQLSSLFLRMGLGDAARREARVAVQLAPKDADPYVILGYALLFDAAGRAYGAGWDRAGAIAALQKARTLNPRHAGAVYHLSDAAIRNAHGRWAEAGADPKLALEAARAMVAIDPSDDYLIWLVKVLAQNNGFAEAVQYAEKLSAGHEERARWLVLLTVINQGAAAGAAKARALAGGAPDRLLVSSVMSILTALRRYEELGAFARETQQPVPAAAKLKRLPPLPARTADPKIATLDAMLTCADVDRVSHVFPTPAIEKRFRDECANDLKNDRDDTTDATLSDSMQGLLTVKVTGDADAWRAEVFNGSSTSVLYLSLERGQAVVWGDAKTSDGVGVLVDRLLARGRDDAAARVLAWLVQDGAGAVLQGIAKAATQRDQRQRVAGAMMAQIDPARALALLGNCKSSDAAQEKLCHLMAAFAANRAKRWAEVISHDDASGFSLRNWMMRADALLMVGRFDEAERLCNDELASNPDASGARALLIRSAVVRNDAAATVKWAKEIAAHSDVADFNQAAWALFVDHRELPMALDLAHRASRARPKEHAPLNTLAAIEAEVGELGAAVTDNQSALPLAHVPLGGSDWLVLGRIAEQLGLTADAITLYRRVTPSGDNFGDSYDLATRRLAGLHASH